MKDKDKDTKKHKGGGANAVTLRDVYESIEHLREEISKTYVTKDSFKPVKLVVYGGAGAILIAVFGAMINAQL